MALNPIKPDSTDRICCLVIGKYGLGKTSLLKTMFGQEWVDGAWVDVAETDDKVCVLSAESGLLAVQDFVRSGHVEGYEISSLEDFKDAYNLLATSEEMKDRYTWVFIDSLTEISSRCDEHMRDKYPESDKTFKRWDDYALTMTKTIKGFRDIKNYSVVFTCLETIEKDQNNRRYIAPDVTGRGLKEKLPSYFDEVLYMGMERDQQGVEHRVFYTQPYGDIPAKDRSGKLNSVEMPNLLKIKNKILGGN